MGRPSRLRSGTQVQAVLSYTVFLCYAWSDHRSVQVTVSIGPKCGVLCVHHCKNVCVCGGGGGGGSERCVSSSVKKMLWFLGCSNPLLYVFPPLSLVRSGTEPSQARECVCVCVCACVCVCDLHFLVIYTCST